MANINLSAYSNEELRQLFVSLEKEMIDRKMVSSANLPAGSYVIGDDIPVGKYLVNKADPLDTYDNYVYVYPTPAKHDGDMHRLQDNGAPVLLDLKNRNLLISHIAITLTVFNGVKFE